MIAANVFVVSAHIHGQSSIGDPSSEGAMIGMLGQMPTPLILDENAKQRSYIAENTWSARWCQLAKALEQGLR
jgi:hypothetical protein